VTGGLPWFAIGEITLGDRAGGRRGRAPGFAVVRAILDAGDPEAAVRDLRSFLQGCPSRYTRRVKISLAIFAQGTS
jgi:thiamine monophosphate synthase